MIQSVGKQTITVTWRPRYIVDVLEDKTVSPPVPQSGHYNGFADWPIVPSFNAELVEAGVFSPMAVSVQPSIAIKQSQNPNVTATVVGPVDSTLPGLLWFSEFLANNVVHCTKLNVRADDASALPSTMEILTPNSFTGQFDRQIVNILASGNMYQNQSNIITLDVDFFITRCSILRVDSNWAGGAMHTLTMDMSFDKYLSLEKAMVENYQLLQTTAGVDAAIIEEVENIGAKTNDAAAVIQSVQPAGLVQAQVLSPWRKVIGSSTSTQPARTKGNNF